MSDVDDEKNISRDMLTLRAHSGPVYGVSFSKDNTFLLSASEDLSGMTSILLLDRPIALKLHWLCTEFLFIY